MLYSCRHRRNVDTEKGDKTGMAAKISVYLSDEVDRDMKLLARHENIKITELVNRALKMYIDSKAAELEFAKKQEQEREEFDRQRNGGV